MRIGLLVCDHVPDRFGAIAGDYPDMISAMLGQDNVSIVVFDAVGGNLPSEPSECDAFIISGSRSSVYDDERWIRELEAFVRGAIEVDAPIFGICFGLQLMSQALGGSVQRAADGWGVGVHTMGVGERRPWMDPFQHSLRLIMLHQDQIVRLPADAVLLGSSEHCENYLVQFTSHCVGVQGHPEFPAAFVRAVYDERRHLFGVLADPAIASLDSPTDAGIFARWAMNLLDEQRTLVS